ncbi:ComEC/Rec2-related protein domain-containing protein [Sphingomonas antarctica]|uniref:hypothetical protein n=1 Tax=Sphingomonas antarctica TaxID=2040274 RepID=UPI0039EA369C
MNIWEYHSIFFLVGLALFPRITLLFFASTPFGWLAWIGWVIAPHLLVAVLSLPFWDSNPVLVIIAWFFALAGTGGEGRLAASRR